MNDNKKEMENEKVTIDFSKGIFTDPISEEDDFSYEIDEAERRPKVFVLDGEIPPIDW